MIVCIFFIGILLPLQILLLLHFFLFQFFVPVFGCHRFPFLCYIFLVICKESWWCLTSHSLNQTEKKNSETNETQFANVKIAFVGTFCMECVKKISRLFLFYNPFWCCSAFIVSVQFNVSYLFFLFRSLDALLYDCEPFFLYKCTRNGRQFPRMVAGAYSEIKVIRKEQEQWSIHWPESPSFAIQTNTDHIVQYVARHQPCNFYPYRILCVLLQFFVSFAI